MGHLISTVVNPPLCLAKGIENWNTIARWLAEPSRRRRKQMEYLIGCALNV